MGTHLRVLSESYPMNTNMTVIRTFSKTSLHQFNLDESSLTIRKVEGFWRVQNNFETLMMRSFQIRKRFCWNRYYCDYFSRLPCQVDWRRHLCEAVAGRCPGVHLWRLWRERCSRPDPQRWRWGCTVVMPPQPRCIHPSLPPEGPSRSSTNTHRIYMVIL